MSNALKRNSLWRMISHQPQQADIFFRAPNVLHDNSFEKGGSCSHPCNNICLGVNGASSIRLLPQTCEQQPAVCWPRCFKWIPTQNKNACVATLSPPFSVNPSCLFRPWQSWPSPNPAAKVGWRLFHKAIVGIHPHIRRQQVLLGRHRWDPAQVGSPTASESLPLLTCILITGSQLWHEVCLCKVPPGYYFIPEVLQLD